MAAIRKESRIMTVQQSDANEVIQVRSLFGWHLAGSSARSYNTGGQVVAAGASSSLFGAAGAVKLNATHETDLHLDRYLDHRRDALAALEEEYDSIGRKDTSGGAIATVFSVSAIGPAFLASMFIASRWTYFSWGLSLAIAVATGLMVTIPVFRPRFRFNHEAEQAELQILDAARGVA